MVGMWRWALEREVEKSESGDKLQAEKKLGEALTPCDHGAIAQIRIRWP